MANFLTPSQIFTQYKQILKSIKPSLNTNDNNSDFIIRGRVFAGLCSGLYGDQAKVNNDTYISSARPEALLIKGQDFGIPRQPATQAICPQVRVTGVNGSVIPVGMSLIYLPTGVSYTAQTGGQIGGGHLDIIVECDVTGQIGNLTSPDTLSIVSPPTGVDQVATLEVDMADGSDIETIDSYRARLLSREQNPPAGGDFVDYQNFAFAADPSVRSAKVRRFGRGLGTVDVYITTGTTDIDSAVTQGLSIVRIPSSLVLARVQAYYNTNVPLTDCPAIYAPTELNVNATMNVILADGLTLSSVPSDSVNNPLGLTCQQLIQREMSRALYKFPVGGRIIPGFTNGFVVAADLEQDMDVWLSAAMDPVTGAAIGKIPILADRQIQKLNGSTYDLPILGNQLPAPGTLSVVLGGI